MQYIARCCDPIRFNTLTMIENSIVLLEGQFFTVKHCSMITTIATIGVKIFYDVMHSPQSIHTVTPMRLFKLLICSKQYGYKQFFNLVKCQHEHLRFNLYKRKHKINTCPKKAAILYSCKIVKRV